MPVLFFIFGVIVLAAFAYYLYYRFTEYDDMREVFDDTPFTLYCQRPLRLQCSGQDPGGVRHIDFR